MKGKQFQIHFLVPHKMQPYKLLFFCGRTQKVLLGRAVLCVALSHVTDNYQHVSPPTQMISPPAG